MLIAVSMRVVEAQGYTEARDALAQDWTALLEGLGLVPVLVPNRLSDPAAFLGRLAPGGVLLTGGDTVAAEGDGDRPGVRPERDRTEAAMVRFAAAAGLPVLGVCRGLQMINRLYGGAVSHRLRERPDVKQPHVAATHGVHLLHPDWAALAGTDRLQVNSFHDDGVLTADLAPGLEATALTDDGAVVEALADPQAKVAAIQWHPERDNPAAAFDRALIGTHFGAAR